MAAHLPDLLLALLVAWLIVQLMLRM